MFLTKKKQASTKFNEFEQQKSMLLYYVEKLNTWLDEKQIDLNEVQKNKRPENLKKCRVRR